METYLLTVMLADVVPYVWVMSLRLNTIVMFLQKATPFLSVSLQLKVICCLGVRSSFFGSDTPLQVPEAFAPKGSSMVTVVLSLSGSGRRTIWLANLTRMQSSTLQLPCSPRTSVSFGSIITCMDGQTEKAKMISTT